MEIELTRIFVKVVQLGSFSRAAEILKLPKSTVSRGVSRLEAETGTKLLLRTTRSLTLTAAGRAFYETCLGPIQILEDARKSLHGQDSVLSGSVRLTAPEDLGDYVISPVVGKLTKEHPELAFELNYSDEVIDLVKEGYDIAIRIGKLASSSFKFKRLGEVVLIPVAAPAYLKRSGKIRNPGDLSLHDCLSYVPGTASPRWNLRSKKESQQVAIRPRIVANQMSSLLSLSVQGAGVAMIPSYLCQSELDSGHLVRVLPDWSVPGLPVSMILPLGSDTSVRLKLASDRLAVAIQKALE